MEINFQEYVEAFPHIHVGIYGYPGSGKDLLSELLFKVNNQLQKRKGDRPFYVVKRVAFADRVREIASWVTGEDYQLYLHHPNKDLNVSYMKEELSFSRRDFMVDIFKYFEKKLSPNWSVDFVDRDIDLTIRDLIASKEWEVELPDLKKAIYEHKPILFVSPDVRQECQFDSIKEKKNGIMIKLVDERKKKTRLKKIEKMLGEKDFDFVIKVSEFISLSEPDESGKQNLSMNMDAACRLLEDIVQKAKEKMEK